MNWFFHLTLAITFALVGCATTPPPASPAYRLMGKITAPAVASGQPLPELPVLPDLNADPAIVEVDLYASEEDLPLLTGATTRMMVFNGAFPGPTIQARENDTVIVHFHNRLSVPTSVHFHGMIINPEHDGGPWNVVSPRQSHTYTWRARAGMPMTGWFHAHPHGLTHVQAPRGMVGVIRILAESDPMPAEYGDTSLVLSDQKFDTANQILPDTEFDRFHGREGDRLFVNGRTMPKLVLRPGETRRLRVVNAGAARFYKLSLPGLTLVQVGADGGLFETPTAAANVLLTPADRVELLVRAPAQRGTYTLMALAHDRGLGLRETFDRQLMTLEIAGEPTNSPPIPVKLRTVAPLSTAGAGSRTFTTGVVRSASSGMLHFALNAQQYDPLRIDNVAQLGGTEVITINNTGSGQHPIHLHNVQFQLLDAAGVPIPRWEDVIIAQPGTLTRFVVKYGLDEFPGLFMLHCHILQHEDDGMMTDIMVNPAP